MPALPPFKYGEVYPFNADGDEYTVQSDYTLTVGNNERNEWGVANWTKPYGFAFKSNLGTGWYFENLEGQYFQAKDIQTTYDSDSDEYYVEIVVKDLESDGKFVVKNRNYSGEYTFTSVG